MKRIVIVGGGIAGLAAAYRIQHTAPDVSIVLVESDWRLGGKIVTDRIDGFVIEGGPDTFLSYKPRGLGLCRELGLEDRLHGTNENIRRTVRAAKLEKSPAYTDILRKIPPAVKLANANSLFIMARDALYHQEIRRGHSPEEAMRIAAQRMLNLHAR